ncbi:MAG: DUF72 domain-containing protein [Limnospira sp.]
MIRIGTSGWSYDDWEGRLYPPSTSSRKRLDYYTREYDTVEVNATYYRWPKDSTFQNWRDRVPENFLMAVKAPGGLTHKKRLRDPETWTDSIESGLGELREKLGIFLVQLHPKFAIDLERLDRFLGLLPDWIKVAVEFRHPSWNREEMFQLLEHHNATYCVMSGANLPCILRATADFVYVRFHGPDPHDLYKGIYSDDDLRWWADRIREWEGMGRSVFAYFNNDAEGNALQNSATLKAYLDKG